MRGTVSGIGARTPIFVVFTLSDGLIVRMVEHLRRNEALEAVGLI
jgi:hypothetical protein